jgi:hypothetical protein
MKYFIASLFVLFLSNAQAQTANVRDIPADGDTNISITKGQKVTEKNFEIVDQSGEIEGEPEVMAKDARSSWKKACDDWKKETKELNKENQVLALNCNHADCAKTENATTTCKSTGTFKIKTKIR